MTVQKSTINKAINAEPFRKSRWFSPRFLSRRVLQYYRTPYRYLQALTRLGLSYAVAFDELTIAEGEVYYFYRHGTCELVTPLGDSALWPVTAYGAPGFIPVIPKASHHVQQHWLAATDYAAGAIIALARSASATPKGITPKA